MYKCIFILILLIVIPQVLRGIEILPLNLKNGSQDVFSNFPEMYIRREDTYFPERIKPSPEPIKSESIDTSYQKSDLLNLDRLTKETSVKASFYALRNDDTLITKEVVDKEKKIVFHPPSAESLPSKVSFTPKETSSLGQDIDEKYHRLLDSFIKKVNLEMGKIEEKSKGLKKMLEEIDLGVSNLIKKSMEVKKVEAEEKIRETSINDDVLKEVEAEESVTELTPEVKEEIPTILKEKIKVKGKSDSGYAKWKEKVKFANIFKVLIYSIGIVLLGIVCYLWIRRRKKAKVTPIGRGASVKTGPGSNYGIENKIDNLQVQFKNLVGNLSEKVDEELKVIEEKEKNIEKMIGKMDEKISKIDMVISTSKETESKNIIEDKPLTAKKETTFKPAKKIVSIPKKKDVDKERELFYAQIYEYHKNGLDSEEISKLTNMSVSEIELILELKEDE